MNAPAKRFSLQRLLTTPVPLAEPIRAPQQAPTPEAALPLPASVPAPVETAPVPMAATPAVVPAPPRISKAVDAEESHPKKKRSYSVDMKLCEDLEILAWYQSRSSSSVVEELIRKHLQHNRSLQFKAREVRSSR
jgi:hypothetical protein